MAPDFKPQFIKKVNAICNIGCGQKVRPYQEALRRIMKIESFEKAALDSRFKSEFMYPGFSAKALGLRLTKLLINDPQSGISKHFHIAVVKPGKISFDNNDIGYPVENRREEIIMPDVARSRDDYQSKTQSISLNPIGAIC